MRPAMLTRDPHPPTSPMPQEDFDAMSFELGRDGIWRAYDENGLVAVAPSWRQLYERTDGRWN